jgi:hypothetical protein
MDKLKYILVMLILIVNSLGCSYFNFKKKNKNDGIVDLVNYRLYDASDYVDHLTSLKGQYLESSQTNLYPTNDQATIYLSKIGDNLVSKNELFFTSGLRAKFYIIEDESPFHFSLPGKNIFISSGLIKKYIKSEQILYCLVAYELIISEKNLYKKNIIIPTGTINTRRMLSLLRLNIEEKVEIHKWAFHILKRVGVDTDNYLSWIQIQNRNSVDFSLQLGDISSISREESLFKAFIIKNTEKKKSSKSHEGSSREFYAFINQLKR